MGEERGRRETNGVSGGDGRLLCEWGRRGGDGRLMCEWGRKWGERGRWETNV